MIDPERLGRALVVNVPFLINAFVKLILAFIDHRTRPKIRFNPDCTGEHLFAPEQLLADWSGGEADFEYVHERYWEPLIRMCAERREKMWEAWRTLGAKVGVREWDVKCMVESGKSVEKTVNEEVEGETNSVVIQDIEETAMEEDETEGEAQTVGDEVPSATVYAI